MRQNAWNENSQLRVKEFTLLKCKYETIKKTVILYS